jgi:hypothetical protein
VRCDTPVAIASICAIRHVLNKTGQRGVLGLNDIADGKTGGGQRLRRNAETRKKTGFSKRSEWNGRVVAMGALSQPWCKKMDTRGDVAVRRSQNIARSSMLRRGLIGSRNSHTLRQRIRGAAISASTLRIQVYPPKTSNSNIGTG